MVAAKKSSRTIGSGRGLSSTDRAFRFPPKDLEAPTAKKGSRKSKHASQGHFSLRITRGETVNIFDKNGFVVVDRLAQAFRMSKGQLAETAGISPESLYRSTRAAAPKTQARVKEMLEIVNRVVDWAGSTDQAIAWYRAQPIPAFGGRTAESLVKDGKASAVRDYLDHVATGGFA
jgi:uncharacterized protein (DUF2384 family)